MKENTILQQLKRFQTLKRKVAALEKEIQRQQLMIELLTEFASSVAYTERMDLISYQQIHSPSADSCKKVRMLFDEIGKFG